MKIDGNLTFCDDCDEVKDELLKRNVEWAKSKREWMDFNDSMDTIIITCMDSRVPVEKIFGLNPGEALVIRNAGNVITEDVLRSVLAGILEIHTKYIIVLGHTRCGMAIKDKEEKMDELFKNAPPNLMNVLNMKTIKDLKEWFGFFNAGKWNENAIEQADILKQKLVEIFDPEAIPEIYPAQYDLDTGKVKFL